MTQSLFSQIQNSIPRTPGVYFFRDKKHTILYVGKAANLRSRLSSYFLKSALLEAAKRRMLHEAEHITWQETETEIEALLLEASLIKKHIPPYNIVMRDDKQYLFVGFTKEQFPRVFFTHQPVKGEFIGPFTESGAVKKLLRSLRKTFPYCTCKINHNRVCQRGELGLCMNMCCKKDSNATQEERIVYAKNIRFLKNVLQGKQKHLLRQFRVQMNRVSKQQEFETAARLRDYIYAIERIFEHHSPLKKEYIVENQKGLHELRLLLKLPTYPKRIEGYDISNIQGTHAVGSMVVFTDGIADKNMYRKFRIRTVKGANDTAMLREVLTRRLAHAEWPLPDVMLIDGGRGQLNAARMVIPSDLTIISIAKREEELYTPERKTPFKLKEMPTSLLYLLQQVRNESHRFAISYYRKQHRKDMGYS
ncbi:MAG: hypothetical protein A3J54_00460 [Candidatus Ryanbacteria bacterium RIFCSPHIGHO2_02_FULL_45_13b]|uniref:Excinuclease ABC subunit C n=1 Tax=Candidatus Ryanbacteria bacterium RIFCSPHIGHO2_02_FULL_45_13b TaxID=1802117 RepID=A0A1G2G479_9BACT|nr:MAG: hypothetical protein A3J54_00460 [Candidatus Ryanbacteria bacterium RIFCSPHIGHO2_02_FULL_45_13b]